MKLLNKQPGEPAEQAAAQRAAAQQAAAQQAAAQQAVAGTTLLLFAEGHADRHTTAA